MWRQSSELGNFSIKRLWFETYPSLLSLLHLFTPPLNFRNPSSLPCLPAHPEVCSSTTCSKPLLPKAGTRRINYGQSGQRAAVSGRKQRKLLCVLFGAGMPARCLPWVRACVSELNKASHQRKFLFGYQQAVANPMKPKQIRLPGQNQGPVT